MKIADLKKLIARLQHSHAASGAIKQANSLQEAQKIFEGSEDKTVDQFVAETTAALSQVGPQKFSAPAPNKRVALHGGRLLAAGIDEGKFQHALQLLDDDKVLRSADWYAIANFYRNAPAAQRTNIASML